MVPLASVLLLGAVFCNRTLCAAFRCRVSRWLGRLSFPLYLIQFPVLVSVTSYAICLAAARGSLHGWVLAAIGTGSLLVCLAAAWAFTPVERLTQWVGHALAAGVLSSTTAASREPAGLKQDRGEISAAAQSG
jgi:peptidoglycan/LPS O-acetylase OafA/YrhL